MAYALREYGSKRKVITMSNQKQEKMDFKEVLCSFHKWLLDEAELKPNSADQYKGYIKKLCAVVDKVFGPGWFGSLALDYERNLSEQKLNLCSAFIESQVRNCPRENKKSWNDWRSAFHQFEEFLLDITDSWNHEGQNRTVVTTYTHEELCRVFLGRLKTQSRYYPRFNILFPTRLLTKIFKSCRREANAWINWLKSDIENMHILRDGHNFEVVSDIRKLEILNDGTVVVTKRDGSYFEMMTRRANGVVVKEFVTRGLRDVSIDHVVPLENILRQNRNRLSGFRRLTELFSDFKVESGENLDPRAERKWVNAFFDQYRGELDTDDMRALIKHDLEILELEFELMDTRENSMKGNEEGH